MRLTENDDWLSAYLRDVKVADHEISVKNFHIEKSSVVCDIYALPSHNHQTFYGKLVSEHGFYKFVFAKAIQNSIWFSDPIYMYRFEEAKRFENHPMKKGRIICRAKLMEKGLVNRLMFTLDRLSDEQPDDTVAPSAEADFTAIRLYEHGAVCKKIFYTDVKKLVFRDDKDRIDAADFLQSLFVAVEKVIGIGE